MGKLPATTPARRLSEGRVASNHTGEKAFKGRVACNHTGGKAFRGTSWVQRLRREGHEELKE